MQSAPDTATVDSEAYGGDGYDEKTLRDVVQGAEDLMDSAFQDPVPDEMKGNNPGTEVFTPDSASHERWLNASPGRLENWHYSLAASLSVITDHSMAKSAAFLEAFGTRGYHFEDLEPLPGTKATAGGAELPKSGVVPSRAGTTVPASEPPQTEDKAQDAGI